MNVSERCRASRADPFIAVRRAQIHRVEQTRGGDESFAHFKWKKDPRSSYPLGEVGFACLYASNAELISFGAVELFRRV